MAENTSVPPADSGKELPEKYFRTFAGDMDALQKGKVPDLAPLGDAPSPNIAGDAVSFPAAPVPLPEPVVSSPEVPHLSNLHGETPGSLPAQVAPAPAPGIPAESVTPLKTYSGDFSDRLKETHASTATVLAAEQDSAPRAPVAPEEKPSRKGLWYIIGGAVLLLLGIVGAYIAYTRYVASLAPVAVAPVASAPIFVEDREELSGSGDALLRAIVKSANRPLAGDLVRLLYIASTTESVFAQLPVSAPYILVRNVSPNGSMAGIVNVGGVQNPFFILSVLSYSDTFAGLLAWETLMQKNLAELYPAYPPLFVATTTIKSGQATTTTVLVANTKPGFYDEVVSNHDVRVYRDPAGRILLLYGYWNQSTLVIARDVAAFTEILQRLANSRAQQ